MVRVIFDGSTLRLGHQFGGGGIAETDQSGGGSITGHFEGLPLQRGYGFYLGSPRQRGAGVGTVLRRLWRYLRPLATTVKPIATGIAKEIGKEGLETGARVLSEVGKGGSIGDVVEKEGKEGARRLLTKAHARLSQKGEGRRRRRRKRSHSKTRRRSRRRTHRGGRVILKPSDVIGQTVPQRIALKKRRIDQLKY